MMYWLSWWIMQLSYRFFYSIEVRGVENLPDKKSFILASNHASYLDPVVICMAIRRKTMFVARDTLFANPIIKWYFQSVYVLAIKRNKADIGALKIILRALKKYNLPMIIFPEGTRYAKDGQKEVQPGIGFIAVKSGVPIVPVHIKGSDRVLPPGAKFLKRGRVIVSFGKPMLFNKKDSYPKISQRIMSEVYLLSK